MNKEHPPLKRDDFAPSGLRDTQLVRHNGEIWQIVGCGVTGFSPGIPHYIITKANRSTCVKEDVLHSENAKPKLIWAKVRDSRPAIWICTGPAKWGFGDTPSTAYHDYGYGNGRS